MVGLVRIAFLWFTIIVLVLMVIALLAVDEKARIPATETLTHSDIARATQILKGTFSRKPRQESVNVVSLTARDLTVASNYLLERYAHGTASVELRNGEMIWSATLKLPNNPLGRFLNVDFRLNTADQNPIIKNLAIGRIVIPEEFAGLILESIISFTSLTNFHSLVGEHIETININDRTLTIAYRWNRDAIKNANTLFAPGISEKLLLVYHNRLVETTHQPNLKTSVALSQLMESMFKLAWQRSSNHNPIKENTALIMVLSSYANGRNVARLFSGTPQLAHPKKYRIRLNKRIDTAQHFMTSAAIAVSSNSTVANEAGLYKELSDSKIGSGFSFADLAAGHAGTRFGEMTIRSSRDARAIQKIMAHNLNDRVYMLDISDLPEAMNQAAFKKRFNAVDSPAYKRMMQKIEKTISRLELYQRLR